MPSPEKRKKSSGTSKHVHWEDAITSASNLARSFRSSRRPVTPFPAEEELQPEERKTSRKRKHRASASVSQQPITPIAAPEGIPFVAIGEPFPVQFAEAEYQHIVHYQQVYPAYTIGPDGMAVPYPNAAPANNRLLIPPLVSYTANGPQFNWYVRQQDGTLVPLQPMNMDVGVQPIAVSLPVSVPVVFGSFMPGGSPESQLWWQVAAFRPSRRSNRRSSSYARTASDYLRGEFLWDPPPASRSGTATDNIPTQAQPPVAIPLEQVVNTQPLSGAPPTAPVNPAYMPGYSTPLQNPQQMMPGNPAFMQSVPRHPGINIEPFARSPTGLFAGHSDIDEPQDFRPADDTPSRMYRVREVDGNWTLRNRHTIDNMGDCRWFITNEGVFYAVRQPN